MTLSDYLEWALGEAFGWGSHDCGFLTVGWVAKASGIDVLDKWRGRYSTELGCARVVRRAGGLEAILGEAAERASWPKVKTPFPGCVGIIQGVTTEGLMAPGMGIYTGRRWASCGERGLVMTPANHHAVWGRA
jgi:hypothetical protein